MWPYRRCISRIARTPKLPSLVFLNLLRFGLHLAPHPLRRRPFPLIRSRALPTLRRTYDCTPQEMWSIQALLSPYQQMKQSKPSTLSGKFTRPLHLGLQVFMHLHLGIAVVTKLWYSLLDGGSFLILGILLSHIGIIYVHCIILHQSTLAVGNPLARECYGNFSLCEEEESKM